MIYVSCDTFPAPWHRCGHTDDQSLTWVSRNVRNVRNLPRGKSCVGACETHVHDGPDQGYHNYLNIFGINASTIQGTSSTPECPSQSVLNSDRHFSRQSFARGAAHVLRTRSAQVSSSISSASAAAFHHMASRKRAWHRKVKKA